MKRAPITRQRSPWIECEVDPRAPGAYAAAGMHDLAVFERRVHDGVLRALRTCDDGRLGDRGGLHLSISHQPAGRSKRYPTWDEIAHARDALLPDSVEFVMILPRAEEYVALHDTTFHLHEASRP